MRDIFTKSEIEHIENIWSSHGLDVASGWKYIEESKENLENIVYNILKPFYAAGGWTLGDTENRINEILSH